MQRFQGKSVYKGIAMGPVVVLKKNDYQVKRTRIEDPESEVKRVTEAVEKSQDQLGRLYDKAVKEVGEASAAIFEVHQMMLEDEDYLEAIQNMIQTEQVNAEYAVAVTGDNFAEMFAAMDDDYMKARSADIKDISERLVRNLSGQEDTDLSSIEPSVIVADDLSPSETVQMDKDKILAFVTVHGSTNSHTAILARMMNIPALIGVEMDLDELKTGMTAVVDGFQSEVDICKSLILSQKCTGKSNQTVGDHKTKYFAYVSIDTLCPGHIGVTAGRTERTSKFCSEEPVQDCNQNNNENSYDKNSVLVKRYIFNITKGNEKIIFVSVNSLVGFTHDLQVNRIKTKLGKDTCQDSRNTHESVKDSCCKSCQHSCTGSGDHRCKHTVTTHQHHDAHSTTGAHGAVNSKVGNIQNTESKIDTDGHDTPDKTLGSSTWKCIY